MPRKYTKRPSLRNKLRFRRKFRKSRASLTAQPVPNYKLVKLKYVDNVTLNPGVASIASHLFRANSLFDPDYSGVGHQPLGFDQWTTFYDMYRVVGAKISATFFPTGEHDTCGVYLDNDTTTPTVLSDILEQKQTHYRQIVASQTHPTTISFNYSSKKFFGKAAAVNANQRAAMTANPTTDIYFTVFAGSPSGADTGARVVQIQIEYIALLTERKTLAQS